MWLLTVKSFQKKYKNVATVLVNCAGIFKPYHFLDLEEKTFDEVIRVNLKVSFFRNFCWCYFWIW